MSRGRKRRSRRATCGRRAAVSTGGRKGRAADAPRPVHRAALLHDHRHDRVLVRLAALLVYPHDLVYAHVAHEVAHNEHKVCLDDPVRVDVAHGVSRREGFLRGDDRDDFDSRRRLGPLGVSAVHAFSRAGVSEQDADVPDGGLDLLSVRSANHKDLLHSGEGEALKGPVQQRRVAYRQQALMGGQRTR